jgi:signal transduction histidine kinase
MPAFIWFCRLLVLAIALLMGGQAMASTAPALRDLAVLVDPQGDMDIFAVATAADQRFIPLSNGLSAGYSRNVHWLRFTIAAPAGEWWLDLLPPYVDDLRLYEPDPLHPGTFLERRAGDQLPFSAREADYRGFIFKLRTADETPRTYYLRLQTQSTSLLVPRLWAPDHFHAAMALDYGLLIGILGVLLAIMALNLITGLWLDDPLMRWFLVFVGCIWVQLICNGGFAAQYLIPERPAISDALGSLMTFLVIAASFAFYPRLFQVKPAERLLLNIYRFGIVLALGACISWFTGHFTVVAPLIMNFALLMTGVGFWRTFLLWRVKDAGSGLLFIANLFTMSGFLIAILTVLGIYSSFYAMQYNLQVTTLGFVIALHLALSERHRALREAHRQALADTERATQNIQREHELHERKGRFIDLIAHEYRTPLTILRTNLDILGLSKDEAQRQTSLNSMDIAVKRLGHIFNRSQNVDDWGGLRSVRLQPLSLASLLRTLITEAIATANAGKLDYALDCDDDTVHVTADPALLNTVLRNLFDNVKKYARPKSVVDVRVMALADGMAIVIANHCAASPGQRPERLLEKNVRGANSTGADGIGMGLYIVKKLVEDMGGTTTIRFDALERFEITLHLPQSLVEQRG